MSESSDPTVGRHSRETDSATNKSRPGASYRRRRVLPPRRGVFSVLLIVLLAAGLAINEKYEPQVAKSVAFKAPAGAAPANATSSAWYCPMVFAQKGAPNAGSIEILNPNDTTLTGTVSYFPQNAAVVDVPVSVPARTHLSLHPGESVDSPYAATLLRFDGGGAAVEHSVSDTTGTAYAPCAIDASAQWHFADGSTAANTNLQIGLFNPFLEDAIADVNFVTNDGTVAPDEFQGVVVPARSFTSLNVGDRVRRRDSISTSISVRNGRIVASEIQTGTIAGVPGIGMTLGATAPQSIWYLPDGAKQTAGVTNQISMFNPNDHEAEVLVSLLTDKDSIAPFQLRVPANATFSINLDKEARVPDGTEYGVTVRSLNGVNVVVQRQATSSAPAATIGGFLQTATSQLAKRWIVPLNETRDPYDDHVYVMNPGNSTATVTVTGVSPTGQLLQSSGTIQPGRRLIIHVDEFASDNSNPGLVIESDLPVVAGRTLAVTGNGLSSSLAVPVR